MKPDRSGRDIQLTTNYCGSALMWQRKTSQSFTEEVEGMRERQRTRQAGCEPKQVPGPVSARTCLYSSSKSSRQQRTPPPHRPMKMYNPAACFWASPGFKL